MASYSAARAVHKTLTGTTVDDVTLTDDVSSVDVINRAAAGGADMFANFALGTALGDPTASGDDTEIIPPGGYATFGVKVAVGPSAVIKVIGNGNAYSVVGKL